jgi:hypothetical protein
MDNVTGARWFDAGEVKVLHHDIRDAAVELARGPLSDFGGAGSCALLTPSRCAHALKHLRATTLGSPAGSKPELRWAFSASTLGLPPGGAVRVGQPTGLSAARRDRRRR